MSDRKARAPHSRRKSLPVIFLGTLAFAAGLISLVGNRIDGLPILGMRPGGDARLVAFEPMPEEGRIWLERAVAQGVSEAQPDLLRIE